MASDLGEMKSRLTILTSFDQFISRFTNPIQVSGEDLKPHLEGLVSQPVAAVGQPAVVTGASAFSQLKDGVFDGTRIDGGRFETIHWRAWLIPLMVAIHAVSSGSGHEIEGDEWYTAAVDWILAGLGQPITPFFNTSVIDISAIAEIACEWRTKVLFCLGDSPQLTILEYGAPKALDLSAQTEFRPLLDNMTSDTPELTTNVLGALFALISGGNPLTGPQPDLNWSVEFINQPPPADSQE